MYFVEFARGDVNNLPRDLCGVLLPLIAFIDLKKKGRGLSLHVEIQFLIELRTQNSIVIPDLLRFDLCPVRNLLDNETARQCGLLQ